MGKLLNVQIAGGDVGRRQNLHPICFEISQSLRPGGRALVAVDHGDLKTIPAELFRQLVGTVLT